MREGGRSPTVNSWLVGQNAGKFRPITAQTLRLLKLESSNGGKEGALAHRVFCWLTFDN
jgi:hypothetical protein